MPLYKKQHYFFLLQNIELTNFVNVPVINNKTFHYSCRVKAFDVVYEEGHRIEGTKLWSQLHVEEDDFEGVTVKDKPCSIYYNFKQVHNPYDECIQLCSFKCILTGVAIPEI